MKLVYDSATIENIFKALDMLPVNGFKSAEILTYVFQQLNLNEPLEKENDE